MRTIQLPTRFITPIIAFIAILLGVSSVTLPLTLVIGIVSLLSLLLITSYTPLTMLTLLLVLAPLRTLIATEAEISLPLDIGQILLIAYIGSWTAYRINQRKAIITSTFTSPLMVIISLAVLFGLNMWAAVSIGSWLTEWLKWIVMGVLVWHLTTSEHRNWKWLLFALLVSAVANAIVGLYIFFGGSGADHLVIGGRFFRAFGTFGQPNPFGGFMGITIPLALMGIYSQCVAIWNDYQHNKTISANKLTTLLLFMTITIILLAALIASWSRGAWLGLILSVGVMTFAIPRRLSTSLGLSLGLGILLIGLWFGGLIPQSIIARLTTAATDFITIEDINGVDITPINYAVVERVAHWQAAINIAESNSLLGVGLGNYEIVYDNYRLLNWHEPLGHAHNYYLNILSETGMIGFLAYLAFWGIIVAATWKIRQHPDNFSRAIAIGLMGSWTYIAVHSVFDNLYVNNLFLHIGVLLSILSILHHEVCKSITLE